MNNKTEINQEARLECETEFLISQILAIAPSSPKAIPKVLQAIGENLGWSIGHFWKVDLVSHEIACAYTWGSLAINSPNASGFSEMNHAAIFAMGVELPGEVWKSQRPRWVSDLSQLEHLPRIKSAIRVGLNSAILFPVLMGSKILGVMEFFSEERKVLDQNVLRMLDTIGGQVSQFIERKLIEDQLKLAYEDMEKKFQERTEELLASNRSLKAEIIERKRVEKEVLEVTQKEQRRFGAQLHDGLCQELTGILLFTKSLLKKMEKNHRLDVDELKKISDMILNATDQARDTARGLYPGELEGSSLMNSLEELVVRSQNTSHISCVFYCPEPILIDNNDAATHLYRIAQEGVSNAIKHGKAQLIEVSLTQEKNGITLVIKDNGVGFVRDQSNSNGIGLHIMRYRAHMMNASFHVEPNIPHGVILICQLANPLEKLP